jgi:hypothetical protein
MVPHSVFLQKCQFRLDQKDIKVPGNLFERAFLLVDVRIRIRIHNTAGNK